MGDITKVKLMDSGTARFPATGLEDAERKVRAAMSIYGEVSPGIPGTMTLDMSDSLYNQFITVKLEPSSTEGQWAASFKEGNSATWLGLCLLRLGARSKCHIRMKAILNSLDNC